MKIKIDWIFACRLEDAFTDEFAPTVFEQVNALLKPVTNFECLQKVTLPTTTCYFENWSEMKECHPSLLPL